MITRINTIFISMPTLLFTFNGKTAIRFCVISTLVSIANEILHLFFCVKLINTAIDVKRAQKILPI